MFEMPEIRKGDVVDVYMRIGTKRLVVTHIPKKAGGDWRFVSEDGKRPYTVRNFQYIVRVPQ